MRVSLSFVLRRNDIQTPKKFSSFSDQVSWISDEKEIKDRKYAEEMLRPITVCGCKSSFRVIFDEKRKIML